MKHLVLRNCFVGDRYYEEGGIYDLPDSLEKSPKNFVLVGGEIKAIPESPKAERDEGIIEDPPLYVSDKPYVSKKKKRK